MQLDSIQLRRLQLEQLKILKVIDMICKENNIKYSLFEGTAIGAIRHKGFIPWDDDLDICMDRKDYKRFCKACKEELPEGYLLTNHRENKYFTQSFSKVTNERTTYVTSGEYSENVSNGIFVDIFPLDKIKNVKSAKFTFILYACLMNLFLRKHSANKDENAEQQKFIIDLISKIILFIIPKSKYDEIAELFENRIEKMNASNGSDYVYVDSSCFSTLKRFYHKPFFDDLMKVAFEDGTFFIFSEYDFYLKERYGNYMIMPEEKDRIQKHGVVKVKFDE